MTQLFLDDERHPDQVTWITLPAGPWQVVRSAAEFCDWLLTHGVPQHISFDNDLGAYSEQGRWCARWMCEQVMDGVLRLPRGFTFTVHSRNNVAQPAIQSYLAQFIANRVAARPPLS